MKDKYESLIFLESNIMENKSLSWAARGIYAYLQTIEDSPLTIGDIYAISAESHEDVRCAVEELIDVGIIGLTPEQAEGQLN